MTTWLEAWRRWDARPSPPPLTCPKCGGLKVWEVRSGGDYTTVKKPDGFTHHYPCPVVFRSCAECDFTWDSLPGKPRIPTLRIARERKGDQ